MVRPRGFGLLALLLVTAQVLWAAAYWLPGPVASLGCLGELEASELTDAAAAGQMDALKAALEKDPQSVNAVDAAGWTALHHAAAHAHRDCMTWLVEHGANVNALMPGDAAGSPALTALERACMDTRPLTIMRLLELGADSELPGHAVIGNFVFWDKPEYLQIALQQGADPNWVVDNLGNTLLMAAIDKDKPDVAGVLLAFKADPNRQNRMGESAFEMFLRRGILAPYQVTLFKTMINHGADPDLPFKTLTVAEWRPMLGLLLDHGAKPTTPLKQVWGANGPGVLVYALQNEDAEMLDELFRHQVNLDDVDGAGGTAFQYAESVGMLQRLLDAGANPNHPSGSGDFALHLPLALVRLDATKVLIQHGANPSLPDHTGHTPAWLARDQDIAAYLLQHHARLTPAEHQAAYVRRNWLALLLYPREVSLVSTLWPLLWLAVVGEAFRRLFGQYRARKKASAAAAAAAAAAAISVTAVTPAGAPAGTSAGTGVAAGVDAVTWGEAVGSEPFRIAESLGWPARLEGRFRDIRWLTVLPLTGTSVLWMLFFIDPYLRAIGLWPNLVLLAIVLGLAGIVAALYAGSRQFRIIACVIGGGVTACAIGYSFSVAGHFHEIAAPWLSAVFAANGLLCSLNLFALWRIWSTRIAQRNLERALHRKDDTDAGDDIDVSDGWDQGRR